MDAEQWNANHPVGTPVMAYPGARPEGHPSERRLQTCTRSRAWTLGHGEPIVKVDGHAGGIALTHVDVISAMNDDVYETRLLTKETLPALDDWLDRAGVFAKPCMRYLGGDLITVGLRFNEGAGRIIAYFGDTIVRHTDGTHTVRRVVEPSEAP
ncbi:hypothetical protein [Streptomyces sp. 5-10]|uniref:hypothetical protein n=1 Tax=Streptomyces sp. 5-10 TaxID=878925 RepID=UPI00168B721C|nr:hypothetical protein [Streptomyces sp. 5-10]MBD3004898.1 hypothetical protein [Streptomyces sp. 5-10]